jgi:hypothetical protein
MATQAAAVSLNMFKHRAKAVATGAASVPLSMFTCCNPQAEWNIAQ